MLILLGLAAVVLVLCAGNGTLKDVLAQTVVYTGCGCLFLVVLAIGSVLLWMAMIWATN